MNKIYDPEYLDAEEKEIFESLENLDISELSTPSQDEQQKIKAAARKYVQNNTKMNIRIDPYELDKIKKEAAREGLKYQTFVKSILHKYLTGQLVEKDKRRAG